MPFSFRRTWIWLLAVALMGSAEGWAGLGSTRFEENPFGNVCRNTLLVSAKEYQANRSILDDFNAHCAGLGTVEVIPEAGWFTAVKGRLSSPDDSRFGAEALGFLKGVGERAAARLAKNNLVTETLLRCEKKDQAWVSANAAAIQGAIPAFSGCDNLLTGLRDRIKIEGPRYRMAREVVRQEASGLGTMLDDVYAQLGFGTAGERQKLSPTESKAALKVAADDGRDTGSQYGAAVLHNQDVSDAIEARHRPVIRALMDSKGLSDPATKAEIAAYQGERRDSLDSWYLDLNCFQRIDPTDRETCPSLDKHKSPYPMNRLAQRSNELSGRLSNTPILAYLGTDTPTDAELTAAIEKVLKNGRAQAADVAARMADNSNYDDMGNELGPESPQAAVNRRLALLKFSPLLLDELAQHPENCGGAVALLRYVQGLDTAKRGAIAGVSAASILLPLVGWGLAGLTASAAPALASAALTVSAAGQATAWATSGLWYLSVAGSVVNYHDTSQRAFSYVEGSADQSALIDMSAYSTARSSLEQNTAWLALNSVNRIARATGGAAPAARPVPTAEQLSAVRASEGTVALPLAEIQAGQLNVGKDQVVDNLVNRMVPAAQKNPGGLLAEDLAMVNKKVLPVSLGPGGTTSILQDGHHFVSTQIYLQTTPYDDFPEAIKKVFSPADQLALRARGQYILAAPSNPDWYASDREQMLDLLKHDHVYIDPSLRPTGFDAALGKLKAGGALSTDEESALREGYQLRPMVFGLGNDPLRSALGMAYVGEGGAGINADYQADFAQFLVGNHPGFREELLGKGLDPTTYTPELVAGVKAQLAEPTWVGFMKSIPRDGADAKGIPFKQLNDSQIDGAVGAFQKGSGN